MAVKWNQDMIMARVGAGAMRGVVLAIGIVERHAVHLITSPPKSGRKYRRRGIVHQASAPSEAPASDTGGLVGARRIELDTKAIRARLIFSKKTALWLEHGTKKMAPRPFARRALFEKRREIKATVAGEISAELRR